MSPNMSSSPGSRVPQVDQYPVAASDADGVLGRGVEVGVGGVLVDGDRRAVGYHEAVVEETGANEFRGLELGYACVKREPDVFECLLDDLCQLLGGE